MKYKKRFLDLLLEETGNTASGVTEAVRTALKDGAKNALLRVAESLDPEPESPTDEPGEDTEDGQDDL